MSNRIWRIAAGAFAIGLAFDFVLYLVLLREPLATHPSVQPLFSGAWPKIVLGEAIFSYALAWIYLRGLEARPALGQGMRFGLVMAFLFAVAGGLQIAPMIPTSETIIIGSIVGNALKVLTQGIVVGVLAGGGPVRT